MRPLQLAPAALALAMTGAAQGRQIEALSRPVTADMALVPDTIPSRRPNPRGALIRAAILPGWGHVYIHRYGRLPFVYAALGGLAYSAVWLGGEYRAYRQAYQYKAFQELVDRGQIDENPRADFQGAYAGIVRSLGPVSSPVLKSRRDVLRRNRDLAILGTGFVWALSVLDAYVGAHLLDFDVSDDLSLRAGPDPTSPGFGLHLTLSAGR